MASIVTLYKKRETRGNIVNKKSYLVPIEQLYMEDGFNLRDIDHDHVASIADSYKAGEYVPPLVVEVQADSSMKVVDGHHRLTAILQLIKGGMEIPRVQCESFLGGDSDQIAFMVKSSQGRNLNAVERARAYKRLESNGFTRGEIASKLGRSISDITNHLSIAEMSNEAKSRISSGEISAALAVELSSKGGDKSIIDAVKKAQSSGRKKATKATVSGWKASHGKAVVFALSECPVSMNDDESATLTVSKDQWAVIESAIDSLE